MMFKRSRIVLLVFGVLAAMAVPAQAKVRLMSLEELIKSADLIVRAKVESIETRENGLKIASANVERVFKGVAKEGGIVKCVASATWTCDSSDAYEGQHAVFFLSNPNQGNFTFPLIEYVNSLWGNEEVYLITGSGQGKLHVFGSNWGEAYQDKISLDFDLKYGCEGLCEDTLPKYDCGNAMEGGFPPESCLLSDSCLKQIVTGVMENEVSH